MATACLAPAESSGAIRLASHGLSSRTLQRRLGRLEGEGATYQGLLDEGRRESARRLLSDTDVDPEEVTFLPGFEEARVRLPAPFRAASASPPSNGAVLGGKSHPRRTPDAPASWPMFPRGLRASPPPHRYERPARNVFTFAAASC